jgi:hypothetical protein
VSIEPLDQLGRLDMSGDVNARVALKIGGMAFHFGT